MLKWDNDKCLVEKVLDITDPFFPHYKNNHFALKKILAAMKKYFIYLITLYL
jgi:hypothetical protein